ncbi:F0F1 ATP synthase subunit gamma [Arcticibacterium luteifluviistationis]|uniref:F0F1 ATP synthase subunit gamma n=1 Tax=Arcticibacterium luteifluviistationis TaxID=1784714 RepID=A0A2Z4G6K4_9BACT|nr:F0F1 ATP synthase subunit gamma [Arcticibacterium luteifluviistationis]AWV96788.1 F0F1 ATP synthase subunit gamma [Arcticibacterium luteifluviistationis]
METQESLRRKLSGAEDLKTVVRTMKAVAASNIGQYETAVHSLGDYYRTVSLGIIGYLSQEKIKSMVEKKEPNVNKEKLICAIVFGSDQGLVGQFNDSIADFVANSLHGLQGKKEIWAVGERVQLLLSDMGYNTSKLFAVPSSVNAITPLIQQVLAQSETFFDNNKNSEVYIFHNQPKSAAAYVPAIQRLLPLDEKWRQSLTTLQWPTKLPPQVIGGIKPTLLALIHEYLFTSLFKASAESLASENASRLAAMQRAEKNIDELVVELGNKFHSLRQSSIDEELFDVISGFEVMKDD